MPKLQLVQGSFTSGELTPDLSARTDFFRYANGCKRLKNFWVQPHGGASKRPGFVLVGEVPGAAALIPFVFNNEQSYCLVFGEKWLRICTEDGFLLNSGGAVLQITSPYTLAQAKQLSWAQSGDVLYLACRGTAPRKLKRLAHDSWEFQTLTFLPDAMPPAWRLPDMPYEEVEEFILKYPANTLRDPSNRYVLENLYGKEITQRPIEIEDFAAFFNRAEDSAGNISPALRNTVYTYYVTAVSKYTGRESRYSSSTFVTGPASNNWQAGDFIRLQWAPSSAAGEYRIYKAQSGSAPGLMATTTDTWFDDINIQPNYAEGLRTVDSPFKLREGETGNGKQYPGVVCFFEQRLVYASSINRPQTLWFSVTGDYEDFSSHSPLQPDDSIEISIASNEVSPLQWLVPMRSLMAGGSGMEWEITSSDGGAFSAGNARAIPHSRRGSSLLRALVVGSTILHVTRSGREIRDFQYDFGTDSYTGNEKTTLAQHLFEKYRISAWDYQPLPHSIIWVVREDGALLGLTYNAEHEVYAWHRHDTQGSFRSVCSLPCPSDDRLFALVERKNGFTVEYLAPPHLAGEGSVNPGVYLDSAQKLQSASPVSAVSGLGHLEGLDVIVLADGKHYSRKVQNGRVSLAAPAREVVTGLAYSAELETMPLEADSGAGPSATRKKKVSAVNIHFKNSFGAEVGTDFEHLERIKWPQAEGRPALHSGVQRVITGALAGNLVSACVKNDEPYPLTILAISPEVAVY